MGSGLILLLLVGAWLAVLVPMALRSHEASSALGTVDRFSDAMRVLSRRPGTRAAAAPSGAPAPEGPGRARRPARRSSRPTPAARRRRVLLLLVVVAVATLVAALLGPRELLAAHAVADLLLVAFVVRLRRQALARARCAPRATTPRRAAAAAGVPGRVVGAPSRVVGIPDRMPARAVPDVAVRVPVARTPADEQSCPPVSIDKPTSVEDAPVQAPARGAQGEPWQPVPLPVPMYVSAPVAPRRVLDLTRPADAVPAGAEPAAELEHILGRRRAVGD